MAEGFKVLGEGSYMGTYTNSFTVPFIVGNYSCIGDGLTMIGSQHPLYPSVSTFPFNERMNLDYTLCSKCDPIVIGNDVWIGMNASIMEGVKIGDGAIVGACSVVVRDVEPYSLVAGNPAKEKKLRFSQDIIKKLLKIQWWNWSKEVIELRIQHFKDVNVFVEKYYEP
jgi:acetyltransferase-like isoleucine patch superfamily enzyme